jgi:hypothetical protein
MDSTSRETDPPGREQPKAPPERSSRPGPAALRRAAWDRGRSRRCERKAAFRARIAAQARPPLPIPGGGRGWERGCYGAVRRPTRRTPPVPSVDPSALGKAAVPGPGTQVCATAHRAAQALSVPCGNGGLVAEADVLRTAVCAPSQRWRFRAQTPHACIGIYPHIYLDIP